MDEVEARRILGVAPGAPAEEVRSSFRRRVRQAHPDLAPGRPGASRATATLVQAYALLRSGVRPEATPPRAAPGGRSAEPARGSPATVDGDSLLVGGPPDEVYRRLVEAAHHLGEITYVDHDSRLLDTVVITETGQACSLLASLQGRGSYTEVFLSLEPLGGDARPAVRPLVRALAQLLNAGG